MALPSALCLAFLLLVPVMDSNPWEVLACGPERQNFLWIPHIPHPLDSLRLWSMGF
ncbi:mCG148346 [Mus musculus]|nr:mCG148346 [Mus musculus]